MSMYGTIGTSTPEMLLAKPYDADIIGIPCEPGNGTVKRGTIMYRKASGLWAPAASANVVTSNLLAILDETVDTTGRTIPGATTTTTIAEDARAYRSGHFVWGKVTLANDGTVTAAHAVVLARQGIVFDHMVETAVFDNTVTTQNPAQDET